MALHAAPSSEIKAQQHDICACATSDAFGSSIICTIEDKTRFPAKVLPADRLYAQTLAHLP
jgi:hypothetical protein